MFGGIFLLNFNLNIKHGVDTFDVINGLSTKRMNFKIFFSIIVSLTIIFEGVHASTFSASFFLDRRKGIYN